MAEALEDNSLERLMRALLAALSPLTGTRATGTVIVTVTTAGVILPLNTYLLPITREELDDDRPYKTTEALQFPDVGEYEVEITSNVGGASHNRESGATFRFDPPIPGIEPIAVAESAITGGSSAGALIRAARIFEDIDSGNTSDDMFAAMVSSVPGVVLSWLTSDPTEGTGAGLRRGSTRGGRGVSFFFESFALYVIVARLRSPGARRREGIRLMQAITRCLSGRMTNDDGEQLATVSGGGVEIANRSRLVRKPEHYVYGIRFRTTQTSEVRLPAREVRPWERTRIEGSVPGLEAPEPTDPLTTVDVTDPMP